MYGAIGRIVVKPVREIYEDVNDISGGVSRRTVERVLAQFVNRGSVLAVRESEDVSEWGYVRNRK